MMNLEIEWYLDRVSDLACMLDGVKRNRSLAAAILKQAAAPQFTNYQRCWCLSGHSAEVMKGRDGCLHTAIIDPSISDHDLNSLIETGMAVARRLATVSPTP